MHPKDRVAETPAWRGRRRQHASRQGGDIKKEEGAKDALL